VPKDFGVSRIAPHEEFRARPPLHRGAGSICEGARLDGEPSKVKLYSRCSTAPKKPLKATRMTAAKLPEQCETMADVRAGVDEVDRDLVALLVRRFGYMDAAARIKTDRGAVRDEARKAQVLDNVAHAGEAAGLDPARLRAVWSELVEQSIAYEAVEWDRLHTDR